MIKGRQLVKTEEARKVSHLAEDFIGRLDALLNSGVPTFDHEHLCTIGNNHKGDTK